MASTLRSSPSLLAKAVTITTSPEAMPDQILPPGTKTYARVRFLPNGLLDVDRKKGKYFKIVQENQRSSPFLQLPAEVRSTIYEYTLGNETFKISSSAQLSKKDERGRKPYLALLLVSRQLYVETVLIPFKRNTFHADNPQMLRTWAGQLPVAAQHTIARIQLSTRLYWHTYTAYVEQVDFRCEHPLPAWWRDARVFDKFPGLRRIGILTSLAQCYCNKAQEHMAALIEFIGAAEDNLRRMIESYRKYTASHDIDVAFERDLNFAPLLISLEDQDF